MLALAIIRMPDYNYTDMICRKDLGVMEYMSCPEAAKKWGISERRVQVLCRENRILGGADIFLDSERGKDKCIPKNRKSEH